VTGVNGGTNVRISRPVSFGWAGPDPWGAFDREFVVEWQVADPLGERSEAGPFSGGPSANR
jgi:hypothetical protein